MLRYEKNYLPEAIGWFDKNFHTVLNRSINTSSWNGLRQYEDSCQNHPIEALKWIFSYFDTTIEEVVKPSVNRSTTARVTGRRVDTPSAV